MIELTEAILGAKRKSFLRQRPIFERFAAASTEDVLALERELGCSIFPDLRYWLVTAGFGDLDQTLSIRSSWFNRWSPGNELDLAIFATDELADRYAFEPTSGEIVFFSVGEHGHAKLANSFEEFLSELVRRDYKIIDWTTGLDLQFFESGT